MIKAVTIILFLCRQKMLPMILTESVYYIVVITNVSFKYTRQKWGRGTDPKFKYTSLVDEICRIENLDSTRKVK